MQVPAQAQVITTKAYRTWMGVDGIARTVVKNDAEVGLNEALENTQAVNTLFKGKKFPLLVDARNIKFISKEARDHFSLRNRDSVVNAFAILIYSPVSRIIGNFFMGLSKPAVPARLFNEEEEALKWLTKFL
jgi:hypothetical protein